MALIKNIADFRYIIATSEVDALVLENNLIKEYNPKYNIMLKDDKSYPFIRIDLKAKFPTIEVIRKLKNDGAKYFGPYMQGISIKDTVELIYSAFRLGIAIWIWISFHPLIVLA
jgi:excinuclease ABC subunit C